MELVICGIIILGLIVTCIILCTQFKKSKHKSQQQIYDLEDRLEALKEQQDEAYRKELFKEWKAQDFQIRKYQEEINKLQIQIDEKLQSNNALRKLKENELNESIEAEKKVKLELLAQEVSAFYNMEKSKAEEAIKAFVDQAEESKKLTLSELALIQQELEDYKNQQRVINETIRLKELSENEKQSHVINLSINQQEDIEFLLSLINKFHNKEIIYKLIWSEYLQPSFNEMIKKQFGINIPKNVIYCIEDNQGKKYIGKTKQLVSKRWMDHIKTSLNIGGTQRTIFHKALYKDWNNFNFSILEKVEESKLNEKEKFYIKFFETDKYGYNMKSGG